MRSTGSLSKFHAVLPAIVVTTTVCLCLTTALFIVASTTGQTSSRRAFFVGRLSEPEIHALSFEDDDVPIFYPMGDQPGHVDYGQRPLVKLAFEETVHFGWENISSAREYFQMLPHGSVAQRHGQQNRAFATALFHSEHCYRIFHLVYTSDNVKKIIWEHVNHCINYIRQQILCTADLTPELGDFMARDPEQDRVGPVRACRDFEAIYDSAAYNWLAWVRYARAHNITVAT